MIRSIGENTRAHVNPEDAKILFVRFQGQDPTSQFLARFQGEPYSVRPGSRAQSVPSRVVKDLQTGEAAQQVMIDSIMWTGFNRAVVDANGYNFVVTKEWGSWRVESITPRSMG